MVTTRLRETLGEQKLVHFIAFVNRSSHCGELSHHSIGQSVPTRRGGIILGVPQHNVGISDLAMRPTYSADLASIENMRDEL